MLTKNLLRYNIRNQQIHPRFLDTTNLIWQKVSKELALLYEVGTNQSREELAELAKPIINNARSPLTAKGLNKLLLDRCTFQESDDALEQFRIEVFTKAAHMFRQGNSDRDDRVGQRETSQTDHSLPATGTNNLEKFRLAVADSFQIADPDSLSNRLYGDLPSRQPLLSFKTISPEKLLLRYNMAQAQGLLFWADSMLIEMEEPDVGVRRKFFQHLKFFRLLALIFQKKNHQYHIQVDGPLNLFDHQRKYGLQLAAFLPSVCVLKHWKINAKIQIENEAPATYHLDQESGLQSHIFQTNTFIPDEFELFSNQFEEIRKKAATKKSTAKKSDTTKSTAKKSTAKKSTAKQSTTKNSTTKNSTDSGQGEWKIKKATPMLNLGNHEWVVPDFSFQHERGHLVHLELFHRWHKSQLLRRLKSLENRPLKLVIGVDRYLTKDTEINEKLQNSTWYQLYGFPFNGFPPVKRVISCLDRFLVEESG